MHFPSCAEDDKKLPYTKETATLTRKHYRMLVDCLRETRTTIQSLNLFLPGLIYGPKIVLKQCNCIRIYLEVRELLFSLLLVLLLFIALFHFVKCIKRANSLIILSDFHSQPATVLTFFRVKYHFHVNYTTCMNTIGSTYGPFFHRNQPLDFY